MSQVASDHSLIYVVVYRRTSSTTISAHRAQPEPGARKADRQQRDTWRYRSRDHSISSMSFPIGDPLEPSLYEKNKYENATSSAIKK